MLRNFYIKRMQKKSKNDNFSKFLLAGVKRHFGVCAGKRLQPLPAMRFSNPI